MRIRVYCRKHNRTHSQHANYHCKNKMCPPKIGKNGIQQANDKCTMIRNEEGRIR